MARTVGIRFRQAGKIFYYHAGDYELHTSAYVVVETAHGLAVGRVVIAPDQVISSEGIIEADLKPIVRLATTEDIERNDEMQEKAKQALVHAKIQAGALGLDMSLNAGEFDLDGSQFTAYFTTNDRVDFRNLVRDLSTELGARVQLLQVGDRDRAKLVDGIDICGERLCCSSWMTNFPSVSIRMAKEQDLPLNPQKISGVCGRLYCCLTFEYDDYKALRGTLPKVGSFVSTPVGEAKVNGIDFNREVVKLWLTEQHELVEVAAIDFQLQNGVAIRPMELVRKIEGPMRSIGEDSSSPLGTSAPPRRQPRDRNAAPPARTERPERPQAAGAGAPSRPEGRRNRPERGPRPDAAAQPAEGAAAQPQGRGPRPPQQRGPRPDPRGPRPDPRGPRPDPRIARPDPKPGEAIGSQPGASSSPPPSQQPQAQGDGTGEASKRRRRRRGRGRGGAGGGDAGGDSTPPSGGE